MNIGLCYHGTAKKILAPTGQIFNSLAPSLKSQIVRPLARSRLQTSNVRKYKKYMGSSASKSAFFLCRYVASMRFAFN